MFRAAGLVKLVNKHLLGHIQFSILLLFGYILKNVDDVTRGNIKADQSPQSLNFLVVNFVFKGFSLGHAQGCMKYNWTD